MDQEWPVLELRVARTPIDSQAQGSATGAGTPASRFENLPWGVGDKCQGRAKMNDLAVISGFCVCLFGAMMVITALYEGTMVEIEFEEEEE